MASIKTSLGRHCNVVSYFEKDVTKADVELIQAWRPSKPHITLINEGVMYCFIRGIYRKYLKKDREGMWNMITDTLALFETVVVNEMSVEMTMYYREMLQRMNVCMRYGCEQDVQVCLRTMAYEG